MSDGAGPPRDAGDRGLKKGAAVAGTFHGGKHAAFRQRDEFVPSPFRGVFDATLDGQLPRRKVELRNLEMIADKKQLVGRDPGTDFIQRCFAVFRFGRYHLAFFGHRGIPPGFPVWESQDC